LRSPFVHVLATALVAIFFSLSSAEATQYWQLTLSYDQSGVTATTAGLITGSESKTVRTPGFDGAPVRLVCNLEWLDQSGAVLSGTVAELPLGRRSAPSDNGLCQLTMPQAGTFVVRVEGPSADARPVSLRLTRTSVVNRSFPALPVPSAFQPDILVLPITGFSQQGMRRDGPLSSLKIRDTGPDRNRLVIVIMGDGYTATNLAAGEFTQDANNLVSAFTGRSPWDVAFSGTNVYRVDVESAQQGADNDPYGTYVNTYFNSSFWVDSIARLLDVDGVGLARAYAAADAMVGVGVWDQIFILVNSTTYGGSGGAIAVASVNSLSSEVILHEFGHSFAGLADEYTTPYPGYPPGDAEPNVDYDYAGSGLKWLNWVEPTTPLPTPDNSQYNDVVGTFQGARYLTTGIYRPMRNCLMRTLNVPFDPVCKEAHMLAYTSLVGLVDSVTPTKGTKILVPGAGRLFTVAGIPVSGVTYDWTLNESVLSIGDQSSINLKTSTLYLFGIKTSGMLKCKVSFVSPLIRDHEISQTYTWTVLTDCNGNGYEDNFDIQEGFSLDLNGNAIPDECENPNCCQGTVGNVDGDPNDNVDIGDLSALADFLFNNGPISNCPAENNVDGVGSIDLSDLTVLGDFLFNGGTLIDCP
jgi:hypothetical protein